jgi:hypothetical protein
MIESRHEHRYRFPYSLHTHAGSRYLSGEECALLAVEYFEEHRDTTLPGEVLFVDLRPAFQKDFG